ncbi:MAG: VTT domain-containing protein [Bryobacterales bacterium]|nr:VTT domain-containing protein [Bryobacterales bacterium]
MRKLALWLQAFGPPGAFAISLIDSAGIPLPGGVDAIMVLTAITNPGLATLSAFLAVVGSAIGCMILFLIARKGGEVYLERHASSPLALKFRAWFGRFGLLTVFIPALVPIPGLPVKVFVLSAGALGVRPRSFLLTILAARAPRYFGLAFLGAQLGDNALPWLTAHAWHLAVFSAMLFAALYLAVKRLDRGVE